MTGQYKDHAFHSETEAYRWYHNERYGRELDIPRYHYNTWLVREYL